MAALVASPYAPRNADKAASRSALEGELIASLSVALADLLIAELEKQP